MKFKKKIYSKKENNIDGISKDNWNLLEKVKSTQRQDHLKGNKFGSPTANDRLMKELRDIFRSDNYKNGNSIKNIINNTNSDIAGNNDNGYNDNNSIGNRSRLHLQS